MPSQIGLMCEAAPRLSVTAFHVIDLAGPVISSLELDRQIVPAPFGGGGVALGWCRSLPSQTACDAAQFAVRHTSARRPSRQTTAATDLPASSPRWASGWAPLFLRFAAYRVRRG